MTVNFIIVRPFQNITNQIIYKIVVVVGSIKNVKNSHLPSNNGKNISKYHIIKKWILLT